MKRELAAAVAIPIVLAILFLLPPIAFHLLVALVALAALWEFYRLAEKAGYPVAKTVGILGATALFIRADRAAPFILTVLLVVTFLAALGPLLSSVSASAALGSAGSTVFGVLSVALPATALSCPRLFSPRAVLFLLLIVWGCDSAAYYSGRALGRHKLAPAISPNKTWEGAIGGLLGASVVGAAAGAWWVLPELGAARGALAGALASSAGQIGDLVESLWKRGAGVKDSGVFLPGHGGFYDRIDSLLFAAPVLAGFLAVLRPNV